MFTQTNNRRFLRSCAWIAILLTCATYSLAQTMPAENDTLNYRIIGFNIPQAAKAKNFTLEIARGHHDNDRDFRKNRLFRIKSKTNGLIAEVPDFGQQYTWRVSKNGKGDKNNYHHFSTGTTPYTDTGKTRVRVISNSGKHKELLVILDHAPVMYDMTGKLVWYLPDVPGVITKGLGLRDIKPTADGTFTLLNNFGAFELDYNGKVLWRAPNNGEVSGDSIENYHHEFTKLSNGHYMIAGSERIKRRVPADADTTYFIVDKLIERRDGWFYKIIDCPTLIEYDGAGKIVWYWKLSEYFTDADYFANRHPDGTYISAPHMNSFYFEEKEKAIYLGFRNLNRIIKLQYPTKDVIAIYGEKTALKSKQEEPMFRAQHCVRVDGDGTIYLFNNNGDRERNVNSSIVKSSQPADPAGNLAKIWEFTCDIDANAPGLAMAGGSVLVLSDGSILANMGLVGRTFIVSPDKKITWNALPEFKNDNGEWVPQPEYRANFIENEAHLKTFIFRGQ